MGSLKKGKISSRTSPSVHTKCNPRGRKKQAIRGSIDLSVITNGGKGSGRNVVEKT